MKDHPVDYFKVKFNEQIEYNAELEKFFNESQELLKKASHPYVQPFCEDLCDFFYLSKEKAKSLAEQVIESLFIKREGAQAILDLYEENGIQLTDECKEEAKRLFKQYDGLSLLIGFYYPLASIAIIIAKRQIKEIIRNKDVVPLWNKMTVGEVFDVLEMLQENDALQLLRMIDCPTLIFDTLIDSFKNKNKSDFIDIVHSGNIDLSRMSFVCFLYEKIIMFSSIAKSPTFLEAAFHELDTDVFCDAIYGILEEFIASVNSTGDFIPEEVLDILNDDNAERYLSFEKESVKKILLESDKMSRVERKFFYKILENPTYADECDKILTELKEGVQSNGSKEIEAAISYDDEKFTLPATYFHQAPALEQSIYFVSLKECIKERGIDVFIEFIDYLAENGYIENNIATKKSFSFRLTGVAIPEKLIDKIEWKGDSKDLLYIIKYFYPNIRKNRKIPQFFTSLRGGLDNSSSYAENASNTFKEAIRKMYPGIDR